MGTVHVSEKHFMASVVQLARLAQWTCYHTHDARRSVAGFPDLVLVRHETMLCIELKSQHGRVTPAQAAWLKALGAVQHKPEVYVWRPSDWDVIERRLLLR
jgi:hypothetical protein